MAKKITRCPHCGRNTMKSDAGSKNTFTCGYCGNMVLLTQDGKILSSREALYKCEAVNTYTPQRAPKKRVPSRASSFRSSSSRASTGKRNTASRERTFHGEPFVDELGYTHDSKGIKDKHGKYFFLR